MGMGSCWDRDIFVLIRTCNSKKFLCWTLFLHEYCCIFFILRISMSKDGFGGNKFWFVSFVICF